MSLPSIRYSRRVPRPHDLTELMRMRPWQPDPVERRLARAATIDDLKEVARRVAPRAVFDYVDGGAEGEVGLRRSLAAFDRVEFEPRVLQDVSDVDTTIDIFGVQSALPVIVGPTGYSRMMHHTGERAVARAAQRAGVPYVLSTMGTTSIEEVASAAPGGRRWFQLYFWADRRVTDQLVARAEASGYDTLVVTADVPVSGSRLRDARNGMTLPPALTVRTLLDGATHPSWWTNFLTRETLKFASMSMWEKPLASPADRMFDPSTTIDEIARIRKMWSGKLVVKGILHPADAIAVAEVGADAIVVSDHGGRQLDRSPVPLERLPIIRDAIGPELAVFLDGGVRSGSDVAAAICLGADAVLLGRAYLYGLMAGGERGVDRVLSLLGEELTRTMQLLGVRTVSALAGDRVRLRD
ncbi:MAG: alpha-hydroxy-acid oxidizing protein [Rhodoglobus sp.]|nr:alpha-hydroxy-acid oxidizing protein [Rhodoglobus sp.]